MVGQLLGSARGPRTPNSFLDSKECWNSRHLDPGRGNSLSCEALKVPLLRQKKEENRVDTPSSGLKGHASLMFIAWSMYGDPGPHV